MIFLPVLAQRVLDRILRLVLEIEVERGAHHEDAFGHRFGEGVDQLLHLVEGRVEVIVGRLIVAAVDRGRRIAAGAEHLAFGHEPGVDQIVEHDVGTGARRRQVDIGREFARRLEQAGEHRRLGEVDVARRLVEIVVRRRVDAEGAAAHVGAVEIELEDLVLGQPRLKPHRQEGFLDLAVERALVGQEQVLGELLRQR